MRWEARQESASLNKGHLIQAGEEGKTLQQGQPQHGPFCART